MIIDKEELINALYLTQGFIHNEKHTVGELNDTAYNTCLVTIQYLLDSMSEEDIDYMIEEDMCEMLDHDRRFMSYEYSNLKGE